MVDIIRSNGLISLTVAGYPADLSNPRPGPLWGQRLIYADYVGL